MAEYKIVLYKLSCVSVVPGGEVEEAEKIYRQYKSKFKTEFLNDFAESERVGVIPEER